MRAVTFESDSKQEGATSRDWRRDSGTRQCERGFEGRGDREKCGAMICAGDLALYQRNKPEAAWESGVIMVKKQTRPCSVTFNSAQPHEL